MTPPRNAPRTPAELFSLVHDLASLDAVHLQLLDTLNDPGSSLSDLVPLIDRDPMLTTRILKRSNSAYFGRSGKVGSVHEALAMLGLANIRELILTSAVCRLFERIPPGLISVAEFWRHSVAVSLLARELATLSGWADGEGIQTAGLLHDVGRVLMLTAMPVEYHKAMLFARAAQRPLLRVEHELFGYTHCQVGGDLFEAWGLPLLLVQAARFHHQPQEVHRFRHPVELVQLADYLAHGMELGLPGKPACPRCPGRPGPTTAWNPARSLPGCSKWRRTWPTPSTCWSAARTRSRTDSPRPGHRVFRGPSSGLALFSCWPSADLHRLCSSGACRPRARPEDIDRGTSHGQTAGRQPGDRNGAGPGPA